MSFEVTATRRRPQNFDRLEGQDFVVSTLKNSIAQGRIAHAYLFSGPRGVGKTSSARLLAKALNCVNGPTAEPCGVCDNCRGIAAGSSLDVIEIDGASNTGVNDVRAIKEEVLFPPTSSRYKIYIIDEVHMLSQSAFNALLKTIEEPPEYVVFIFATTETQKVPATVRSRCQQFNFQLIPTETVIRLLKEAASETGIQADEEALFWIARESTGSMRDAYTLFDQVVSFSEGHITMDIIRDKLGLAGTDILNSIMACVLSGDREGAISQLRNLIAGGVSVEHIIKDFTDYFRNLLFIKEGIRNQNILGNSVSSYPESVLNAFSEEQLEAALEMFLNLYRSVRYSINPRFELELAVSRLFRLRYTYSNASVIEQLARLKNDLISGEITPLNPSLEKEPDVLPAFAEPAVQAGQAEPVEPVEPAGQDVPAPPVENIAPPAEPEPVSEPEPASEPLQEERFWTAEELQSVLPDGVGNIENTEEGLVLQFGSRFYYTTALRNREAVTNRIHSVTGTGLRVIFSFSEELEDNRQAQIQSEQERKQEEQKERLEKADIYSDLLFAFEGREIK